MHGSMGEAERTGSVDGIYQRSAAQRQGLQFGGGRGGGAAGCAGGADGAGRVRPGVGNEIELHRMQSWT